MGLSAAVIDALVAAGATVEQLAAAVKADLAEQENRKTEKRAKDAARQRKSRASRDVTVTPCDDAGKEIPPHPHKKHTPPVEAKASTAPTGGRAERGSKIPEDWTPPAIEELSPEARKLASQWPAASYRAEAEAFRNFWLAETRASSRKSNWNRAWANRIVDVHGKVMRQARFAAAEPEIVDESKWTAERRTEYARRLGTGPPQPIGNVVARVVNQSRAGAG